MWHSANPLPSACHVALGKDSFADHFFAEWALPRAALGKAFADGKGSFAECGRHSAKAADPVVVAGQVPWAGVAAMLVSSIWWRVSLLLLHRAGQGSHGWVSLLLHRAHELYSPADGGERTPLAWALLAMRALLITCRLVLDVLGIWILVKLDWSRLDAYTNNLD